MYGSLTASRGVRRAGAHRRLEEVWRKIDGESKPAWRWRTYSILYNYEAVGERHSYGHFACRDGVLLLLAGGNGISYHRNNRR